MVDGVLDGRVMKATIIGQTRIKKCLLHLAYWMDWMGCWGM